MGWINAHRVNDDERPEPIHPPTDTAAPDPFATPWRRSIPVHRTHDARVVWADCCDLRQVASDSVLHEAVSKLAAVLDGESNDKSHRYPKDLWRIRRAAVHRSATRTAPRRVRTRRYGCRRHRDEGSIVPGS